MSNSKFKVVILTHGGCEKLLRLICLNPAIEIAGVYIETPKEKHRSYVEKIKRSVKYDGYGDTFRKLLGTFAGKKTEGRKVFEYALDQRTSVVECCRELDVKTVLVEKFHDPDFKALLSSEDADLGILYGTNIIRDSVFSIPRLGSINIHQGLAPLYRGGPTVFWELFNDENEIGITVHFVAKAVDTGSIVLQERIPLKYDYDRFGLELEDFLGEYRSSLVAPSSRLIAEAVAKIAEGTEERIEQDISIGKRYRLPSKKEKNELIRRLRRRAKG